MSTSVGLPIGALAIMAGIIAALVMVIVASNTFASGAPAPQPAPTRPLTVQQVDDFLANAKTLSAAADALENVAVALKRNEVVGVPGVTYTADQVDEINNAGLAAFYNAVQAGSRGLSIANISTGTLNNFAAANPDLVGVQPTYCSTGDATKCPGYEAPE